MRRNAAVLSFTLVPSREPRGTQPRKTLDISEGLARAPCSHCRWRWEHYPNTQALLHGGSFALNAFLQLQLPSASSFAFALLDFWNSDVSHLRQLKCLKPMSNTSIHADSSCCWTLSSSSQPDTLLWEEWVRCVPPRLAGGRIGDIFRMTRGAHALK